VIPPIKQIVCASTGEGRRNLIKTLGEYNKNYLHLMLRRLQALDCRQEQRTLVAKLLSRISPRWITPLRITNSLDSLGIHWRPPL